jgi:alkanesulfonate monooxygenase SsuD/methylene tetrahydromethanopterin reductase-like flavin-dependent oxidoreductase (luciferase family)
MKIGDKHLNLGIMFKREHPPEDLLRVARNAEAAGYDEFWVVEDFEYGGGIAQATAALAATEKITVGLGIMPGVVRNPVYAAMEIASLARLYPGRFLPGFGHGVADWMKQIGAFPASQLKALEEIALVVRHLLRGEHVDFDGSQVHIHDTELVFPPAQVPPVSVGVRGEKSLRLAGRAADGTILAEFASPDYVRWARERIAEGQAEAGHAGEPHRVTVFAMAYFDADTNKSLAEARSLVASTLYYDDLNTQLAPTGILPQVEDMRSRKALEAELPADWARELTITGTPAQCLATIRRYAEAGVDSLVLVPPPEQAVAAPDTIAERLKAFLE